MGTPGPVHAADSHHLIRVHRARANNLKNGQHLAEYVGSGASTVARRT